MKYFEEIINGTEITGSTITDGLVVEGLSLDSRKIKKNYVFFVSEATEKYIQDAFDKGACVAVGEKLYAGYPTLRVKDMRKAAASMSSAFYEYPQNALTIIGVVGTNGKTSVTHILRHLIEQIGGRTAVIGTLGVYMSGYRYDTDFTTPDSPELFGWLRKAVDDRIRYVVMEISAHAIYWQKIYGLVCDICIYTNCTRDHLDFFGTMERYAEVKKSYFVRDNIKCAIVNADCPIGREIIAGENGCCISYGIENPCDVFAINIDCKCGTDFVVNIFDEILYIHSPLYGIYNVSNLLPCLVVCKILGATAEEIETAVVSIPEIEGRFNVINWRSKIVIDFAHTPDGLEKILTAARMCCDGKLFVVFGCGGNRDKGKRAMMGAIASKLADVVILTEDNSRNERTEDIIADIAEGVDTKNVYSFLHRKDAVEFALRSSAQGDVVVLAGKGAEKGLEKDGIIVPYSDKECCLEVMGRIDCNV